jgi:hypothetical protein
MGAVNHLVRRLAVDVGANLRGSLRAKRGEIRKSEGSLWAKGDKIRKSEGSLWIKGDEVGESEGPLWVKRGGILAKTAVASLQPLFGRMEVWWGNGRCSLKTFTDVADF